MLKMIVKKAGWNCILVLEDHSDELQALDDPVDGALGHLDAGGNLLDTDFLIVEIKAI